MEKFNRAQIPAALAPRAFNFPDFQRFRLANGLQVVFARHDKLPTLAVQMVIASAANYDPAGKEGLASYVADMLPEGTTNRSSFEISQAFEDLGTQFNTHAGWNVTDIEMIVVKKQLQKSMTLFCDVLFNPAFEQAEIERLRKKKLHQRVRVADNAGSIAQEKFNQVVFSQTRYAIPAIGQTSQIKSINKKDLQDFYNNNYVPQNATLVVVGDMDSEGVKKMAEKHFSHWQGPAAEKVREPRFNLPESSKVYLVNKTAAQQAEIRVGHLGISRHNSDFFAATLANQILGGYFLSRLNLNLREDKGFTYGVHSRFVSRKALGPFQISSAIETEHVFAAIQEIIKEMKMLCEGRVSAEELQQAKGYLSGIFPIAFESCPQIAAGLSGIVEYDLDDDFYRTYREKLLQTSNEDVLAAAQKYFHPDNLSIVVCTDTTKIQGKFESLFDVEMSDYQPES